MSRISFNTNNSNLSNALKLKDLKPGETFRFRFGRRDRIYMKLSDARAEDLNGDCIFDTGVDLRLDDIYASLGSGQVYRHSEGAFAEVVRVKVYADVEL